MLLNEADTRAKLIDPAISKRGWTEDLIRREETAGTVDIINGKARRRSRGRIDYVLRVKVNVDTQPVALALIEAKKESLPPGHGLDQAKGYAECKTRTNLDLAIGVYQISPTASQASFFTSVRRVGQSSTTCLCLRRTYLAQRPSVDPAPRVAIKFPHRAPK